MKTKLHSLVIGLALLAGVYEAAGLAATNTPAAIPWNQIGTKAGADYQGDGLAVTPNGEGARLHCVFQRLDGEATPEGLWLTSTVTNTPSDCFRVTAMAVGRVTPCAPGAAERTSNFQPSTSNIQLEDAGIVSLAGQTVRFTRPGLMEEYSVSMDGVRQDFVVPERPAGAGELTVRLAVSGARVEPATAGAKLVLDNSGRKLAYSRLRATDATGKELPARIEVAGRAGSPLPAVMGGDTDSSAHEVTCTTLIVVVNDAVAVYPVRIDPTFSDANWIGMGALLGVDGLVSATAVDGAGNLYIGGYFTTVNGIIGNNIAKWNGRTWSALGSGMDEPVYALAVSGSTLYAGGEFVIAGGVAATGIAQWDGTNWSALGSGMGGDYPNGVSALVVSGGMLYAGGDFTTAGGVVANGIAQWDGSSWSALGSGVSGGDGYASPVSALAVSGGMLYAGGDFTTAGDSAANNIAQWNGSSWSALGSGMSGGFRGRVRALAVLGSALYAGGFFTNAGGSGANYIAQWDGSSWSPLSSGVNDYVAALAVSGSTLYAGGQFTTAGGGAANGIAKWNGSNWSSLNAGMNNYVAALAVSGRDLYVGGASDYDIAKWDGSSWSALGSEIGGLSGSGDGNGPWVGAVAVVGSTVYVGGDFTGAGANAANYIAKWNGSSWSTLGSGVNGIVFALEVSGGTLYAGGEFTEAGGSGANYIAKWNGSSWSTLGSGVNGIVFALAVSGGTLYAGGDFTMAGGNPAASIAQWNGSSWSALGSGMDNEVSALAVSGGTLYAGGLFTTAGGNPANAIAEWDGSNWSALGSGISGGGSDGEGPWVEALAVSGGTLYAGGDFNSAGDVAANYIAEWDGSSWSALGSGISGAGTDGAFYVQALAVSGGTLYAGGDFTMAGDSPANYIAQWDGTNWSPLGSGISPEDKFESGPYVYALAASGNDLYVGGDFKGAGGTASYCVARAILRLPSLTLWQTNSSTVAVSWPSPSPGFVLQQNSAGLSSGNWSNVTDSIVDDGTNKMITQPMGTNSFFRLILP